jgi:hypothetical protein
MSTYSFSPISRRRLLRFGGLAGLLCIVGCGEAGTQTVTTPPAEGGVRSKLDKMQDKAEEAALKKKKKR